MLVNGFNVEVPFILVPKAVPFRRNCISLCSFSSIFIFTTWKRWRLLIVSKAADISVPEF